MTDPLSSASAPAASPTPRPPAAAVGQGQALGRLALVLAAVVLAVLVTHTTDVLIVVAALVVMIMVHELGHFATAKWSRMKVTEYFLGFGPRLWSIRRGETEYGVKAIPIGGYVRILGMSNLEEVDPADEARTYRQKPFHNRLAVALAGSAMHAVMAFVLVFSYFSIAGLPSSSVVQIQALAPLAHGLDPAGAAGLKAGDVVVSVDGRQVTGPDMLAHFIATRAGKSVTVVVKRNGADRNIVVTPAPVTASTGNGAMTTTGHIGVLLTSGNLDIGPLKAFGHSFVAIGDTVTASVGALGEIFSAHGLASYWHDLTSAKAAQQSEHSATRIQSIYGAARTAVQGVQSGWGGFIAVMVSINVFVGMLNLLPMLPLDGGHVVIAIYERIRSRRGRSYHADVRKLAPITYAFVLFLGVIVLSSFYLDITHPVSNPFR